MSQIAPRRFTGRLRALPELLALTCALGLAPRATASDGVFTPIASPMSSPHYLHTATLLPSGQVLIAGGFNGGTATNVADLFDPVAATFTSLGMSQARENHTATLLPSGQVLLAGGSPSADTAELFDGSFHALPGTMASPHSDHTATLLPTGKVLIAGGFPGSGTATNAAELFDPVLGTFTSLFPVTMTTPRDSYTATLLPSGKVLLAGGDGPGAPNTAELFDPALGTFTALAATMTVGRLVHTATLLPSGQVLIAGGLANSGAPTDEAEIFDPALGTFTPLAATMTVPRWGHQAALLPSGKVLIAGGETNVGPTETAEIFDRRSGPSQRFRRR